MGRARRFVTTVVVLGVVGLVGYGVLQAHGAGLIPWPGAPNPDTGQSLSPDPAGALAPPVRPDDAFAMTVRYVYDGDTVSLQHDTPTETVTTTNPIRVRLIGIDTPEGSEPAECWATEARDHLAAMLPEGATVWVGADRETWDDYKRRLFYLWADDGTFINHPSSRPVTPRRFACGRTWRTTTCSPRRSARHSQPGRANGVPAEAELRAWDAGMPRLRWLNGTGSG